MGVDLSEEILLGEEVRERFPLLRCPLPLTRTSGEPRMDADCVRDLVRRFLEEDIGPGDVTTNIVVPEPLPAAGHFVAREDLVVCGLPVVEMVFRQLDPAVRMEVLTAEGGDASKGDSLARVAGRARSLLSAERVALNLLQRLSGIATLTRRFVEIARECGPVAVLDTRKTTPGLRHLEKYAVVCGGGRNHRVGLFDAVLIKDNHLAACGGIRNALRQARQAGKLPVEVEVDSLEQLAVALDEGVEAVLLDNMSPEMISAAVGMVRRHPVHSGCWLEASGGIRLEQLAEYARTGVDGISVGALTHSARAVDISLDFEL